MPTNRPNPGELLAAVRRHLLEELLPKLEGATAYDLRVAVKAIDIVGREFALHADAAAGEQARLRSLLGQDGEAEALNQELCARLREGRIAIDDAALRRHLRATVMAKLAIDNPGFPLYQAALRRPADTNEQD
jgi:hypothetical protein